MYLLQPGEEEAHNSVQYRGGAEGGKEREDSISRRVWEEEMAEGDSNTTESGYKERCQA